MEAWGQGYNTCAHVCNSVEFYACTQVSAQCVRGLPPLLRRPGDEASTLPAEEAQLAHFKSMTQERQASQPDN